MRVVFDILHDAEKTVEACGCEDGCYKCIQSGFCKEGNQVSSKLGAQLVLRSILGFKIDADTIPAQDRVDGFQTITEATYVRPVDGMQVEVVTRD